MKKKTYFFLAFACAAFVTGCSCSCKTKTAVPEASKEELNSMTERSNSIAFSFYAQKAAGKSENFFFSPYGMRAAFAMARDGARGSTADEMNKVFSFPENEEQLRNENLVISAAMEKAAKGTVFSDANSLWPQKGFNFLPEYLSGLKKYYGAVSETADYVKDIDGARNKINSWAASKTNGKIKELFAEGALNSLTRLVLANAVYFKGSWRKPFTKNSSFEADFHLNSGEKGKAMLMRHESETYFPYGEEKNIQFLAMPYKAASEEQEEFLEMMIILPYDKKAFINAEKNLSSSYIKEAREKMSSEKVRVFLPKFSFSSSHDLNEDLKSLGMRLAFNDKADFSGMTGDKSLYLQKAVQKTFIDVSEEGTEAAAVTGISMGLKSMAPVPSIIFRADKPFIFLIRDVKTGLILFIGKIENPK